MSLPPGFLDELRTRLSLGDVVGRKVTWDSKKSNPAKGDLWSPCPFHQEKTASFHVDDRKGFYYCFGCHQKGDAISFVRETENVGFMEAIEILAGEAGMQMPARDPKAQEKMDRATELANVMEEAVKFYKLQYATGAGSEARSYLANRNMPEDIQKRYEIGFAPDGWQNLWDHLTGKGIKPDLILEAGLAKPSSKGKKPYDTFRNRIMFPIRDVRGRAIAFGGRAMDPNDSAKYLNSPETPLFDKSRTLYNLGPAREAAGKTGRLIVAEGYMDVIALGQFGFNDAVAPLGTAVTETQLAMMWRVSSEPIIALDGDTAGLRAAHRVIDLALPLLEAGKSLRFVMLPKGQDPDDLLKSKGANAFQDLIDNALPLVKILWDRETADQIFDSPERRADLDKRLRAAIQKIKDVSLKRHYGAAIQELRSTLFAPKKRSNQGWTPGPFKKANQNATTATRLSPLAQATNPHHVRESVIAALMVKFPQACIPFESELERLHFSDAICERIRLTALRFMHSNNFETEFSKEISGSDLEMLLARPYVSVMPIFYYDKGEETAGAAMAEELAKLHANKGIETEVAEAEQDLTGIADEGVTWRLQQAALSNQNAKRGGLSDASNSDESEKQYADALQKMLDDQIWVKKKR